MAGVKGKSGPPGNANNFRHGLAAIENRRENGITTDIERGIKAEILQGLVADKGGEEQMSSGMLILAELVASDAAWLRVIDEAISNVLQKNPKAAANPRALSTLDSYKRPIVNSLAMNLQKYGLERVAKPTPDLARLLAETTY